MTTTIIISLAAFGVFFIYRYANKNAIAVPSSVIRLISNYYKAILCYLRWGAWRGFFKFSKKEKSPVRWLCSVAGASVNQENKTENRASEGNEHTTMGYSYKDLMEISHRNIMRSGR